MKSLSRTLARSQPAWTKAGSEMILAQECRADADRVVDPNHAAWLREQVEQAEGRAERFMRRSLCEDAVLAAHRVRAAYRQRFLVVP